ncbi:MAG: prolyl oligopeptidase family serine peptidase [Vicinamibacteria bacterium]
MHVRVLALCLLASTHPVLAQTADTPYKLPPQAIVDVLDAAPPPLTLVSPARDAVLVVEPEANPPIALLAQPMLRLAGVRISPALSSRQRTSRYTGITLQPLEGAARRIALPAGARIAAPVWSPDGRRFAFARDLADGVELWLGDAASASARAVPGLRVNDVLGRAFEWADSARLLVRSVPAGRGPAPQPAQVPSGPVVQESAGKASQMATFQDLLASPGDERLFAHYASTQLVLLDAASARPSPLGRPGLYSAADLSPDGRYLLATTLEPPFSYRVPYQNFARAIEVRDRDGRPVATIARLPVSDQVPRQGVPEGPRFVGWQPLAPASLVWVEALDGGDPMRKAEARDRILALAAPFTGEPRELLRLAQRFSGLDWTARPGVALVRERDRARRWTTTRLVDLASPAGARVVFDRSERDSYEHPGDPVRTLRPDGQIVLLQDGDAIYLAGDGASPTGDRPFLDRLDLVTLKKQRLFHSGADVLEEFVAFAGSSRSRLLVRRQSRTQAPNLYVVDEDDGSARQLTAYRDAAAERLAGIEKELVTYQREDGVTLSGTLYLPAGRQAGERRPALVWAYPLEYSDADTAGQVRARPNAYSRPSGISPVFLALRGYVVLMDATMPVVGDPETVNDSFVEQIAMNARAALAMLEARGVADPKRALVGGHSYGAFMTANLLAHTDLFVAGIARSGAYNRTLTPFGFQTERRSFWEARDLYIRMSPFSFADRIKEPVLLIHGAADNNSGTFPIQSERLFEALRGSGGTARLVMLPHEAHGYRARESVLHALAEMIEWADRFTKGGSGAPSN